MDGLCWNHSQGLSGATGQKRLILQVRSSSRVPTKHHQVAEQTLRNRFQRVDSYTIFFFQQTQQHFNCRVTVKALKPGGSETSSSSFANAALPRPRLRFRQDAS